MGLVLTAVPVGDVTLGTFHNAPEIHRESGNTRVKEEGE